MTQAPAPVAGASCSGLATAEERMRRPRLRLWEMAQGRRLERAVLLKKQVHRQRL
jgi:hypothetical protein